MNNINMSQVSCLLIIPEELLLLITGFLDVSSLVMLSQSSKNHRRNDMVSIAAKATMITIHLDVITNGYDKLFEWLIHHIKAKTIGDPIYARTAIAHGRTKILKYLHGSIDELSCNIAAKNGQLETLKYLREHEFDFTTGVTCSYAVENGHLEIVKYLHENRCNWSRDSCIEAAKNGHLDVLKYLHENGCLWNKWSYYYAVENGHLDIIKYLWENKCPCSEENTCRIAAKYGRLEILKYLRENGCQWNKEECYTKATKNGHAKISEYINST